MSSFNKVILLGNLTRDPQMRTLPSGTTLADFGLAASRKYHTAVGEEREEVLFIDCTAFGRQAEVVNQYCKKGRQLLVEGRLKYDTWGDEQSGKKSKISLIVESFQFLGPRDGAPTASEGGAKPWRKAGSNDTARNSPRQAEQNDDLFEDAPDDNADIPF